MSKETEAANYYSKDFEWNQLRLEIETDPSFLYHLLPFIDHQNVEKTSKDHQNVEKTSKDSVEDSQAWNKFHTCHSTGKFFKERRYLLKEFPELASCRDYSKVLEVGCGNGSTALPILRAKKNIVIYACDCSSEALDRAKENIAAANLISSEHRFCPFLCDVSTSGFPKWLACSSCQEDAVSCNKGDFYKPFCLENSCCIGGVDLVTMIFTLSALPHNRMPIAIRECFSVLKPGGMLLFRDYGLYDMTMLRFDPEQRVGYREYMRSDGTRSYFFSLESTRDLFASAGFTELELEYCCVRSTNRRNGKIMRRVWVHGKFQKPKCSQS
ncbi:hypothetical protein ACH5RR_016548 [Cinchona calisaya]|uniref:tRNA N(3)-methylcytidine methyltransferase n=1 Tax=Cinchona calisaya TaxID=153742 RepID=A0ABD2ZX94_9GENT